MLRDTNGTLWEEWWLDRTGRSGKEQAKSRSDAQTESAFPPALFAEYLLGIQPTKPGWKEVSIKHHHSSIKNISGKNPTTLGILSTTWSQQGDKKRLEINTPNEMRIVLNISQSYNPEDRPFFINGKQLQSQNRSGELTLKGGEHVIEY